MENITDGHYEPLASAHDCLSPGVSSQLLRLHYLRCSEPPAVLIQVVHDLMGSYLPYPAFLR